MSKRPSILVALPLMATMEHKVNCRLLYGGGLPVEEHEHERAHKLVFSAGSAGGKIEVVVDGVEMLLDVGESVIVPAGVKHSIRIHTGERALIECWFEKWDANGEPIVGPDA